MKQTFAPTQQRAAEYSVQTITTTDRTIPTNYSATIRGRQDIAIYPQVSGTISQVCITEGQRVTKGQTLFIIDQVPYKAALRTAEANVEAAKAAVATAQLTYDSKKELFSRNVVSQYDLSTAENSLLTAKAQLAQADAALVNAANNLSYTVVKAPSNGVVGTLPYRVGAPLRLDCRDAQEHARRAAAAQRRYGLRPDGPRGVHQRRG